MSTNAFGRITTTLIGGRPDTGNAGVAMLVPAWRAIPKGERTPDAVRALASALCEEAPRLGGGSVIGGDAVRLQRPTRDEWWTVDETGEMMLLDRRLVERLRAGGAESDAATIADAARRRWSKGGAAPLEPWLIRLDLEPLARVWDVDLTTGAVVVAVPFWGEGVSATIERGLWVGEAPENPWSAPADLDAAMKDLGAAVLKAAAGSTCETWEAPRWQFLAAALWPSVKAELEQRRRTAETLARWKAPAVVRPMVTDVFFALQRQQDLFDATALKNASGKVIGHVATTDPEILRAVQSGDIGRTVAAQKMLKAFILQGHAQAAEDIPDYRVLTFDGGLEKLARLVGRTGKDNSNIRTWLEVGAAIRFKTTEIEVNGLWTWTLTPAAPGRRACLRIVLGDALLPGYVALDTLQGSARAKREARRLIPELKADPPVQAVDPSLQGAVYAAHRAVIVAAVDDAPRMAAGDGFAFDPATVLERFGGRVLANKSQTVLGGWLNGDDGAPPLLQRVGRDRYTLSDTHKAERDFIEAGGAARNQGQRAGAKGKDQKREAADRVAKGRGRR